MEVKGQTEYRDPNPIPAKQDYTADNVDILAQQIAKFIREKMYGADVRESLARWVEVNLSLLEYFRDDQRAFKVDITGKQNDVTQRQSDVEERQSDLEDKFVDVLANATVDSELINARDSNAYGKFPILDGRLENIEGLLAQAVPAGFTVKINHNLNRNPTVVVKYYEYAIGTEPNGFGTGPTFGGTATKEIASQVQYDNADNMTIQLPIWYALAGAPVQKPDGNWYLIDGFRTLKFIIK